MTDAHIPQLDNCSSTTLLKYFENSWELEETLMKSLVKEETFYLNPDPLRNKLIFYLGHSAVFYINKLIQVGLIKSRINPQYETLFEIIDMNQWLSTWLSTVEQKGWTVQWPEVEGTKTELIDKLIMYPDWKETDRKMLKETLAARLGRLQTISTFTKWTMKNAVFDE
jgi:hypothetical protein